MTTKDQHSRLWLFKTIAVLLPFLLLGGTELVLRITRYGYDTGLFLEDKTGTYYQLNPDISKKYFTIQENATVGYQEQFRIKKEEKTFRIFVLGVSSSIGFPYMHNGAFSRILKYRLQFEYPDIHFEIINLSVTAVNSYTLYDFSKELIRYEPDAILIYAGHNEYYGALGVASTSNLGRHPGWIRATIKMKEWKLGQLLFHIGAGLKGVKKETVDYSRTLMERMTREQSIPFRSALYDQGVKQYTRNMTDILELFHSHEIPVFAGTLVSNERSLPPFISGEGEYNAEEHFRAGNEAYGQGDYSRAKINYVKAKEYDQLRFRAPEEFNAILRSLADRLENVYLADVMSVYEEHSPHGILDATLLLEHVHPNLSGQRLISDTYHEVLCRSGILPEPTGSVHFPLLQPGDYPFTPFDTIFGDISILLLKELWPFYEPLPEEDPEHIKSYEEQIAGACAVRQVNWYEAMQHLYGYYQQKGDIKNALRIMEGICLEFPYNGDYFLQAGKLGLQLNEDEKAWFYFNRCLQLQPSSEAASQVVIALLKLDRPHEALPYIDGVINDRNSKVNFGPMKEVVGQIVLLKDSMEQHRGDTDELREKIAGYYTLIGNNKAAEKYRK